MYCVKRRYTVVILGMAITFGKKNSATIISVEPQTNRMSEHAVAVAKINDIIPY